MLQRQLQFFRQFDPRLWVLVAGWFVAALGFAASIPFLSIYFHSELGLSTSQIGLFFAAQAIVRSIFQAVGGEMSDRMGRRGILIHSQTIRAFSFLLLGMAIAYHWGYWWITVLFTVNSIFGSLFMPAVYSLVADILPPEKRLYGYAVARSANNLGWAVGPAIGGYLAKASYPSLFYLSAVLTLSSALIFRFFLKVPPLTNAPTDKFRMRDLIAVKDDKNLATHAVLTLLLYLVVAQLIAPFSVYAVSMVGISETQLGFLFTLNGLMVALLQIPITRLFAHKTFTYQLALGSVFYFVGYGMLGILIGFEYFIFALFVVTLRRSDHVATGADPHFAARATRQTRSLSRHSRIHGDRRLVAWSALWRRHSRSLWRPPGDRLADDLITRSGRRARLLALWEIPPSRVQCQRVIKKAAVVHSGF